MRASAVGRAVRMQGVDGLRGGQAGTVTTKPVSTEKNKKKTHAKRHSPCSVLGSPIPMHTTARDNGPSFFVHPSAARLFGFVIVREKIIRNKSSSVMSIRCTRSNSTPVLGTVRLLCIRSLFVEYTYDREGVIEYSDE